MTGTGQTAAEALAGSIELARLADRSGFTPYWMHEHHAMPGVSTSSPPVMLTGLTAETSRPRSDELADPNEPAGRIGMQGSRYDEHMSLVDT